MPHLKKMLFIITCLIVRPASTENDDATSLYQQGIAKNKQGLLIQASILFTQAIDKNPEFAQAYYQRGLSFDGMGEKSQAIKDYKQAVDFKASNLQPYLALIQHFKTNTQYLAALIITDQLIENIPDQAAGGYYDKAQIYELMNNSNLAIKAYELALKNTDEEMSEFNEQLIKKISHLKEMGNHKNK